VVVRPMQAALARSGGEHPTLGAVYVEEGSLDAAGVQSRIDRHHEALLLDCVETRLSRTQDANAQPPFSTTTTTTTTDRGVPYQSFLRQLARCAIRLTCRSRNNFLRIFIALRSGEASVMRLDAW
jgi:hypothetical protein